MSDKPRTVLEGVDVNDLYRRVFPDKAANFERLRKAASGVRGVESTEFLETLAAMFAELAERQQPAECRCRPDANGGCDSSECPNMSHHGPNRPNCAQPATCGVCRDYVGCRCANCGSKDGCAPDCPCSKSHAQPAPADGDSPMPPMGSVCTYCEGAEDHKPGCPCLRPTSQADGEVVTVELGRLLSTMPFHPHVCENITAAVRLDQAARVEQATAALRNELQVEFGKTEKEYRDRIAALEAEVAQVTTKADRLEAERDSFRSLAASNAAGVTARDKLLEQARTERDANARELENLRTANGYLGKAWERIFAAAPSGCPNDSHPECVNHVLHVIEQGKQAARELGELRTLAASEQRYHGRFCDCEKCERFRALLGLVSPAEKGGERE